MTGIWLLLKRPQALLMKFHLSINCIDFSEDSLLVAAGMSESYIRVWSLDGKALPSSLPRGSQEPSPSPSRRLIGHSGPVYAVSFSPSIASSNPIAPSTRSQYLLSSSADKSVRLWSLETWTCLVVYKGHDSPVWDVTWGPFGLYFLTGSLDRTSRLWRTDHIEDLRMFVGHDKDIDTVCFHPNSAYVFTGSCDKIVRMWAVANGYPVRMFTGHAGNVTALACSPSGRLLASADDTGTIILWDLSPGKLKKRMRGHGKGGIWSLSWSVESTVLASGGADGTVRIWDVSVANDANGLGRNIGEGGTGQKLDGNTAQLQAVAGAGTKKKGKDVVVTSDQISAFPTKKTPVYKVRFTRQNLVVAGGPYLP
jgi:transcription initiation factor TFIID subunit 5